MLRRRFVASAVAALAGLFGLKAAKGERVSEAAPRFYTVSMRLSDGKIVKRLTRRSDCEVWRLVRLGDAVVTSFRELDRVVAHSAISIDHAVELAEAARLRYVISSAMG